MKAAEGHWSQPIAVMPGSLAAAALTCSSSRAGSCCSGAAALALRPLRTSSSCWALGWSLAHLPAQMPALTSMAAMGSVMTWPSLTISMAGAGRVLQLLVNLWPCLPPPSMACTTHSLKPTLAAAKLRCCALLAHSCALSLRART